MKLSWVRRYGRSWLKTFCIALSSFTLLLILLDPPISCVQSFLADMVCSPLWIVYLYLFVLEIIPMAALVTSGLTLAVIATQYVGRKGKLAFLQVFRPYSNIAGGLVTLASVGLPWWVFGVYQTVTGSSYLWDGRIPGVFDALSLGLTALILFGGLLSMVSRLGSVATLFACASYFGTHSGVLSGLMGGWSGLGYGFWLALEGAVFSLIGVPWNSLLIDTITRGMGLGKKAGSPYPTA